MTSNKDLSGFHNIQTFLETDKNTFTKLKTMTICMNFIRFNVWTVQLMHHKKSGTNCKAENMSTAVTKKSLCHRLDQRLRCCNFDFVDTRIELPIFFLKPRGCFTSECTVWEFVRAASIPVEWGFTVCRWLKALQSNISKSVQKRWANVVFTYVD